MKRFIEYVAEENGVLFTLTKKDIDEAYKKISKNQSGNILEYDVPDSDIYAYFQYLKGRVPRDFEYKGKTIKIMDKMIFTYGNGKKDYNVLVITPDGEILYPYGNEVKIKH